MRTIINMGIGIDIVEIKRISLEDRFIDLVLSDREKELLYKRVNKKEFLAGRFAAKEAFLKANHKGLGDIRLKDIEVLNFENGQPYIVFNNIEYLEVSISHEKEYAVAVVNL